MFKTLFETLITTLTGVAITPPVEALASCLSLIMITILCISLMNIFMPNSKKYNRIIGLIICVMICIITLATFDIPLISIKQYLPVGGTA